MKFKKRHGGDNRAISCKSGRLTSSRPHMNGGDRDHHEQRGETCCHEHAADPVPISGSISSTFR